MEAITPQEHSAGTESAFRAKVERFALKHGCKVQWQALRFGYVRAEITVQGREAYTEVLNSARRLRNVNVETNYHSSPALFEGFILLMDAQDRKALSEKLMAEQKENEAWWQRYHAADEKIRILMRCGTLS